MPLLQWELKTLYSLIPNISWRVIRENSALNFLLSAEPDHMDDHFRFSKVFRAGEYGGYKIWD